MFQTVNILEAQVRFCVGVSLQFFRYAVVGLASNAIAYAIYLALTHLGLGPKVAMSLLYVLGVLQTFVFNKRWTFGHQGDSKSALIRYCLVYCLGYAINLLALAAFVDGIGYAHEAVQGVMILLLAAMLFLLQKFWVFQ